MTVINVNRQTVLVAEREFDFSDFTSAVAKDMIYLKPGTRILYGYVDITEAFNSGSSDAITIGDSEADDVDRYATVSDATATGITAFGDRTTGTTGIPSQTIATSEAVTMTWTGSGTAPTAGAGLLCVEYVEDARQTEFHTYRG